MPGGGNQSRSLVNNVIVYHLIFISYFVDVWELQLRGCHKCVIFFTQKNRFTGNKVSRTAIKIENPNLYII